jgi:BirA family biotin operon repressor/biotin-[acetyl-CoA-carboxylase] ligase
LEFNVNNTYFTGKFVIQLASVDSTNNYARSYIAKTNPTDGTVIIAGEQLAGRGQSANSWLSEPHRNLTLSIIYHTSFLPASKHFFLNMAVSLGVASAVNRLCKDMQAHVSIKWPNDIYIGHRKVSGILIENTISGTQLKHSVIGVGLNVNQTDFGSLNATSLKNACSAEFELNAVLEMLLSCIERYFLMLRAGKYSELKVEYLQRLYRLNELCAYASNGREFNGKIVGLDGEGRLMVEVSNSIVAYGFKEIAFLP